MRARRRRGGLSCLVAVAIVGALSGAANEACALTPFFTLVGCSDSAVVMLDTASGTWTAGTYAVDMTVDGTAKTCTFATTDPASSTWQINCSAGVQGAFICRSMGIDAGCDSVPPQLRIELSFAGTPSEITLNVARDGRMLGGGTMAPKYGVLQPNGPDCEPTCHVSSSGLHVAD